MNEGLVQALVNGILLGGFYAILGVGFSLVYGVMGIINLAHASMVMIGSYLTFSLFSGIGLDPFLSIPLVAAALFVISWLVQKYLLNSLIRRGFMGMTVVSTFGLNLFLINVALLIWSADYRGVVSSYSGVAFELFGIRFPLVRIIILALSLLLTYVLWLFLIRTKTGKAIRAVSLNREAAVLMGIDVYSIYNITFGIGGALAGMAGALLSPISSITPFMGGPLLGIVFSVAVLGGLGNVSGAVIAGIVLGVAQVVGVHFIGTSWQLAISYGIFILVLLVRPQGLRGVKFVK
ncbi:MAG: branched-chain amino acid ABC transporter permease [Thermoleophilia bacterium]|nr:branched-chain amino acid ABC transporter permease [Thermoleophilia bacterium]